MKFLENKLREVIKKSKQAKLLEKKLAVSNFEFVFITLLDEKLINYDDYIALREEHAKRNQNLEVNLGIKPYTLFNCIVPLHSWY